MRCNQCMDGALPCGCGATVTPAGNVITPNFGKKPPEDERYIFVCGECQCRTFNLFDDGTIMCAYCDTEVRVDPSDPADKLWRRCLPRLPDDRSNIESEAGTVNVNHLGDTSLARRRVVSMLEKWSNDGELALIAGYNANGASHGWFGIETEEQRAWALEKLGYIIDHITSMSVEKDMENVIRGKPDGSHS